MSYITQVSLCILMSSTIIMSVLVSLSIFFSCISLVIVLYYPRISHTRPTNRKPARRLLTNFLHPPSLLATASPHSIAAAHPKPRLAHLPVELLDEIFRLACTDGGYTGCSLSLACKHIRATSRAARFHSVSLLSGSRGSIKQFLDVLHKALKEAEEEGGARPRIAHLCLSLTQYAPEDLAADRAREKPSEWYSWFDLEHLAGCWDQNESAKHRWNGANEYGAAVQALIAIAADHLETLCLYGHREWVSCRTARPKIPVPAAFPRLRELAFVGDEPVFSSQLSREDPMFPVLDRLHVVAETSTFVDFQRWLACAPNLKTLRVTCERCLTRPHWMDSFLTMLGTVAQPRDGPSCRVLVFMRQIHSTPGIADRFHAVATSLRECFRHARTPMVFVPYYHYQDIDGRLAGASNAIEELVRKDWVARIARRDGLFLDGAWSQDRRIGSLDRIRIRIRMFWLYRDRYIIPLVVPGG